MSELGPDCAQARSSSESIFQSMTCRSLWIKRRRNAGVSRRAEGWCVWTNTCPDGRFPLVDVRRFLVWFLHLHRCQVLNTTCCAINTLEFMNSSFISSFRQHIGPTYRRILIRNFDWFTFDFFQRRTSSIFLYHEPKWLKLDFIVSNLNLF